MLIHREFSKQIRRDSNLCSQTAAPAGGTVDSLPAFIYDMGTEEHGTEKMSGTAAAGVFCPYKTMNTCLTRLMIKGEINMQENKTEHLEPNQMEKVIGGADNGDSYNPEAGTDGIKCPACGQPLKFTFQGGYRCINVHCPLFTDNQDVTV